MYIQIEELRGMTAEITKFCKENDLHTVEDFAQKTNTSLLEKGEKRGVDLHLLMKMATQSRQIMRLERLLLDRLVEGHFVFVETPLDQDSPDREWPFRIVEEAQAPYGNPIKIAEKTPVKV